MLPFVLAACTHGEPFNTPDFGSNQPIPGSPARLTTSVGADFDAAWLADESGLLYTGDRPDIGDVRCVMLLPATGGQASRSYCPADQDTFNEFVTTSPGAGGLAAFVRVDRARTAPFPNRVELAIAPLAGFRTPQVLHGVPFTIAGQPTYGAVHQIRWLDANTLVYRGGFDGLVCDAAGPCGPGQAVFVSIGLGLVVESLAPGSPGPAFLPGTDYASSVAASEDGDALYYTVTGQSRVYRLVRSTGSVTIVFDQPGEIIRDVQVAGNRLVVVGGGNVRSFVGQGIGPVQTDQGGNLYLVDLGTGNASMLNAPATFYQHPALAPSGTRLVAESGGDLWLFNLP